MARVKKIGILLIILLCLGAATVWVAAVSGLVTVPVVSPLVYETPVPLHVVAVGPPLETYISETFGSILTSRLQSGSGNLSDRMVEITLPEASITTSFRAILRDSGFGLIDADAAQIAIDEQQGVELFLPLANQSNGNALRLLITLGAKDGLVVLNDVQVKIGNLTIPFWLTDLFVEPIMKQGLNSLNQEIGRYASVEKIEAAFGTLNLSGGLTVEIMKIQ